MPASVLLTGATGNIGVPLLGELRAARAPFAAMSSRAGCAIDGVEVRHGDFGDPSSLSRAFSGVETLFLLLPLAPDTLGLARNAVAAARSAGVRHVVRASVVGADAASSNTLLRLHGRIDAELADSGIACTVLRPSAFMQNYATYQLPQVRAGTLHLAHGEARQAFIDVRDIAAIAARILRAPQSHAGKVYALSGAEALTEHDVAAHLTAVLGRDIRYVPVTFEQAAEAMRTMGLPEFMVELLDAVNRLIADGEAAAVTADAPALLGRAPRTFAQFARDVAAVWG